MHCSTIFSELLLLDQKNSSECDWGHMANTQHDEKYANMYFCELGTLVQRVTQKE